MLANELDQYKGKGNRYMKENIQEIQELYIDKEREKEEGKMEDEEVILIKPYEVSIAMTSSTSQMSFITKEIENLSKYMKFVCTPTQTRIFRPPPPLSIAQVQRRTRSYILEKGSNCIRGDKT